MYKSKPTLEDFLAYTEAENLELEAKMEESYQQFHAEIETNNELISTLNIEFIERRELGTDEEYCLQLDTEFEDK
jgi:ClpP class serine protease